jgi:hypothetical protein
VALARVQPVGDGIDGPALSSGIAALEKDEDSLACLGRPTRHGHQLFLERLKKFLILLAFQLRHSGASPA